MIVDYDCDCGGQRKEACGDCNGQSMIMFDDYDCDFYCVFIMIVIVMVIVVVKRFAEIAMGNP